MRTEPDLSCFSGQTVLITGGLGFIGSNLAIRLVELGAHVTLLDAMLDDHGGNEFNIDPIRGCVTVHVSDVRSMACLRQLVRGQAYIFHLAGYNDHVLGQTDPFPAIDINIRGSAALLEACRLVNPDARLIYTGTRGEYGTATIPVREDQAENPRGVYETTKLAALRLFRVYHELHGLRTLTLRLANIYGERAQMQHDHSGVANWFIGRALEDATIQVFGEGLFKRDFVYVQDTVEALLMCAAAEEAYGQTFNVGNDQPSNFRELAELVIQIAGSGRRAFVPFSPERALIEPGDVYCDIEKIRRVVGWSPATSLEEGLRRSVAYYREHKGHYW